MERNGIVFHWNERVQACVVQDPGSVREPDGVTLTLGSGLLLTVDEVLIAAGRKSNVENLNLPTAGVAVGDRGLIHVDEHFRTNVPHIYAAGDVIGFPALASTSMEQARRAVRHALGLGIRSELSHLLPNGIYTIPEVGMIGATEESLKRQGVDYVVGRASYRDNARGRIIGDSEGFLKLLFRREDMKLLGVHVMGEQATEVVHIGMMAMLAGATADVFDEACFNLPSLGGLVQVRHLRRNASRVASQRHSTTGRGCMKIWAGSGPKALARHQNLRCLSSTFALFGERRMPGFPGFTQRATRVFKHIAGIAGVQKVEIAAARKGDMPIYR